LVSIAVRGTAQTDCDALNEWERGGASAVIALVASARTWAPLPKNEGVPRPDPPPEGYHDDISDVIGEAHDFHDQTSAKVAPGAADRVATPRFKLLSFDEIKLSTKAAYLVRHIIPRQGLVVVWGPPKCGKTFWVFDLVMHIALGRTYRGRRVKRGVVVYVVCEGEQGIGQRVEAYRQKHLSDDASVPDFYLVVTKLDLVKERNQLIADIKAQIGTATPVIIVIDTLNRSIAGSESDDKDMTAYIKAAGVVQETFQCVVLAIHHCGINETRPRGHTALTGGCDAQIAITRDGDDLVCSKVEYMKDGPEGDETRSRLEVVELGQDDDGETMSSCVIAPADDEAAAEAAHVARLGGKNKIAFIQLKRAIADAGEIPPASSAIPEGVKAVTTRLWREYCYSAFISEPDTPTANTANAKQKAFKRAAEKLQADGHIGSWNDWAWIV
jgi:hypothetical protein